MGAGAELLLKPLSLTAFPTVFVPSRRTDSLRVMLKHVHSDGVPSGHILRVINNKVYQPALYSILRAYCG